MCMLRQECMLIKVTPHAHITLAQCRHAGSQATDLFLVEHRFVSTLQHRLPPSTTIYAVYRRLPPSVPSTSIHAVYRRLPPSMPSTAVCIVT
jgi:hypothetical protein